MSRLANLKKWYLLKPVLISVIILLVYFSLLIFSDNFNIFRNRAYDFFCRVKYNLRHLPSERNNIIIISIDDRSYEKFNRKWPWGREVFINLVYKLAKSQPKAIGLNMAFVGESDRKEIDLLLADAFRDAGNVVIASYFDEDGWYHLPEEIFQDAVTGFGFTNRPEDEDGVVRLARLFARSPTGEIMAYSFELKLLELFIRMNVKDIFYERGRCKVTFRDKGNGNIRKMSIPTSYDGTMKLSYSVKPNNLLRIPIIDVLYKDINPDIFKDKVILLDITVPVIQDVKLTPLGLMTNAGIIANGFISLLRQDFIKTIPHIIDYILAAFFCIITGIISYRNTLYKSTLYFILFLGLFSLTSVLLSIFGLEWSFFGVPFVISASYVAMNIYKYIQLLIERVVIRHAVITDPLTGLATRRYFKIRLQHDLRRVMSERGFLDLAIFGIDNFSQLVSNIGSDKVDEVVKDIGRIILKYSRKTRGADFVSRYGEKEFCVILHNTPLEGTKTYVQRIQKIVNESKKITLSAGIVIYPLIKTRSSEILIECARAALRRGEKEGIGRVSVYDQEMDKVPLEGYGETVSLKPYEIDASYILSDLEERNKELVTAIKNLRKAHEDIIKTERIAVMGKITAQIHHELNKPLGNLRDCIELIQREIKVSPESDKLIQLALSEVERMTKLNNDLRDFYGPKKKEVVEVNIHSILDEMLNLSKKHLMVNRIKLNKSYDEKAPIIKGYPEELKQVFLNMIINAIDSMSDGGELAILTKASTEASGLQIVEIHIKDTGCGISSENMDKLFKPFFTTKDETKGTGLGLYASSQIIDHHGGNINVQSVIGKGTTFVIKLPVRI